MRIEEEIKAIKLHEMGDYVNEIERGI